MLRIIVWPKWRHAPQLVPIPANNVYVRMDTLAALLAACVHWHKIAANPREPRSSTTDLRYPAARAVLDRQSSPAKPARFARLLLTGAAAPECLVFVPARPRATHTWNLSSTPQRRRQIVPSAARAQPNIPGSWPPRQ